jgi:hypothetical protein
MNLPPVQLVATVFAFGIAIHACSPVERDAPLSASEVLPAPKYIARAFQSYALVALSELHGNPESKALFTSIVRDPDFQRAASDIVVESGTVGSRTQSIGTLPAATSRATSCRVSGATRRRSAASSPCRCTKRCSTRCVTSTGHWQAALEEVAGELERDAALELLIKAFADAREPAPDVLSTRRALAVTEWLARRGIDARRLTPLGCGAVRPLTFGRTEAERELNRRAELVRRTSTAGCEPPW